MIVPDLRSRLEADRSDLLARIAGEEAALATALEDKGEDTTPSQHPADVASDLYARESAIMTELSHRSALAQIDDALARIARGTYGLCVDCGRTIAQERLESIPEAARCLDCQRRAER